MSYLALDIGSSFIKYTVFDMEGKRVGRRVKLSAPEPTEQNETRYEVSAEAIWGKVKDIVIEVAKDEPNLVGIVLCTQMHGFILADENKTAITPYISWQDNRCMEYDGDGNRWIDKLHQLNCAEKMKNAGVDLKPNLSICNLYALLQEKHWQQRKIHFCTLGSYLIWKMTGNNICHITNGAATGLLDIVNGCWNRNLIEMLEFSELKFPQLELGLETCGTYTVAGKKISVFPDLGDHQTSVLGSMARPNKDVNISIGTAGLVSVVTKEYLWMAGEVRPYFDGLYLNTQRGLFGGRDLEVLVNFLVETIEIITGTKPDVEKIWSSISTDIQYSYDFYKGLDIKTDFFENGMIAGISRSNFSFYNLLKSLYEKAASEYHDAINEILTDDHLIENIVFSGGAARKNQWLKNSIINKTKYSNREPYIEEEALLGLFRVALVCSGICGNLEDTMRYVENIGYEMF